MYFLVELDFFYIICENWLCNFIYYIIEFLKKSWFLKLKKLGDIFFLKFDKIKIYCGYVFIVLFILYVFFIIVFVIIICKGINKC